MITTALTLPATRPGTHAAPAGAPTVAVAPSARLDYLDATRAFALLLGIVFHASLSFTP